MASACLISLVDFFTRVIFLRSALAVPWLACKWAKSLCLSDSVSGSEAAVLATPADLSCSSRVTVGFLSSVANSAIIPDRPVIWRTGGRFWPPVLSSGSAGPHDLVV